MLRINLLPAYLGEIKKTKMHYVLAGLLFVIAAAGMAGWYVQQKGATDQMASEATEMDQKATAVEQLKSSTDALATTIKPLKDKVNFVKQVRWYNGLRPRIFEQAARYTDPRVEYTSMAVQGDTLSIRGRVKKLSDAANYYLAMSANPDVKAVGWKGIYGWPNNQTNRTVGLGQGSNDPNATGFDIDVVAQLISSVAAPAPPGGGSAVGGGGGGMGGGAMGPGGSMGSDTVVGSAPGGPPISAGGGGYGGGGYGGAGGGK